MKNDNRKLQSEPCRHSRQASNGLRKKIFASCLLSLAAASAVIFPGMAFADEAVAQINETQDASTPIIQTQDNTGPDQSVGFESGDVSEGETPQAVDLASPSSASDLADAPDAPAQPEAVSEESSPVDTQNAGETPLTSENAVSDNAVADGEKDVLYAAATGDPITFYFNYIKLDREGSDTGIYDRVEHTGTEGDVVYLSGVDPVYYNHFPGYNYDSTKSPGSLEQLSLVYGMTGENPSFNLYFMPILDYSVVIQVVNEDGSAYDNGQAVLENLTWDTLISFSTTNAATYSYTPKQGYKVGSYYYKYDISSDNLLNKAYLLNSDEMTFGAIAQKLGATSDTTTIDLWASFVERDDYVIEYDVSELGVPDVADRVHVGWSSTELSPIDSIEVPAGKQLVWSYTDTDGYIHHVTDSDTFSKIYKDEYGETAADEDAILLTASFEDATDTDSGNTDSGNTDSESTDTGGSSSDSQAGTNTGGDTSGTETEASAASDNSTNAEASQDSTSTDSSASGSTTTEATSNTSAAASATQAAEATEDSSNAEQSSSAQGDDDEAALDRDYGVAVPKTGDINSLQLAGGLNMIMTLALAAAFAIAGACFAGAFRRRKPKGDA